ncbi:MAG: LPXTG cell wall anchor domain-containing protein [Candidatus Methanosuratincola sp.]
MSIFLSNTLFILIGLVIGFILGWYVFKKRHIA